jgi:drug/metabolite transporter (DMT)-like permease
MLTLCCAFWAFSFPAMKALGLLAQRDAPGWTSAGFSAASIAVRFWAAAALLTLWVGRDLRHLTRLECLQGLGIGVCGSLGLILQMDGMAYTAASTSAFLTQGYCIWIPLWFSLRSRRVPAFVEWFSALLVLGGAMILAGLDAHSLRLGRGEWENLLGSVLFAGQILMLDHPRFAANNVRRFSWVMFLTIATVCSLLVACVPGRGPLNELGTALTSPTALGLTLLLVGPCTLLTFLWANRWQREVPAAEASLLYCTEPVFTSLVTWFFPGWLSAWAAIQYPNERLTANLVLGGGMILGANLWLQWRNRQRTAG